MILCRKGWRAGLWISFWTSSSFSFFLIPGRISPIFFHNIFAGVSAYLASKALDGTWYADLRAHLKFQENLIKFGHKNWYFSVRDGGGLNPQKMLSLPWEIEHYGGDLG